jgi:steroid 5-alpha reductase family enzyme
MIMENTFSVFAINLAAVVLFMIGVWLLSLVKKDASIVDGFWGLGFILIAWITFFLSDGYSGRRLLIAVLTTIWGIRLAVHIFWRHWGKEEDKRYQAWRANAGDTFWIVSLFKVFGLQAVLLWIISLNLQVGQLATRPDRLTWLDLIGICIWAVGFLFESIGDWQLLRFKTNPQNQGKIMDRGLWAYTRHPNYFGEMVVWWGIFLITLATPGSIWTVISPLLITFLLLKVSGVTLLEKTILDTRPEYRKYMQRTNAFIPWFPKKKE